MRVVAVHGINGNGARNVDILANTVANQISGAAVVNFDYGCISLLRALWALSFWRYDKVRRRLANKLHLHTHDGDHVIAHSFGAAVVFACMQDCGRTFGHVWLVAPALSIDDHLRGFEHCQATSITVVANPYDRALKAGRWIPWIDMSTVGLEGVTPSAQQSLSTLYMPTRYLRGDHHDPLNHSYAFAGQARSRLASKIADQLRNHHG